MKNILILGLLLSVGCSAFAQQKTKTNYMLVTIDDNNGEKVNMVVTRTDSAQLKQHLDLSMKHVRLRDYTAVHDSIIMAMLKTYFGKGWKLVSTSQQADVSRGSSAPALYEYYLSKEQ
jgi:hypothetical protein